MAYVIIFIDEEDGIFGREIFFYYFDADSYSYILFFMNASYYFFSFIEAIWFFILTIKSSLLLQITNKNIRFALTVLNYTLSSKIDWRVYMKHFHHSAKLNFCDYKCNSSFISSLSIPKYKLHWYCKFLSEKVRKWLIFSGMGNYTIFFCD